MTLYVKGDSIISTADKMSGKRFSSHFNSLEDLSGSNPYIPIADDTPVIEALRV